MTEAGSAENFGKASIPLVLNLIFHGLNSVTKSQNVTLLEMGKIHSQLPLNPTYNPAFGSWLNSIPTFKLLRKNFTLKEMKGLYGPLLNASKFGPFTDQKLLTKCKAGNLTIECGLAINFLFLQDSALNKSALGFINALLCPHQALACFNISHPLALPAVGAFIGELPKIVMWYLESNSYGLTTTRKQTEITLGYVMKNLPFPPKYKYGIPVPGTVTSHEKESDVKTSSTFYTCESTVGDRFTYAGKRVRFSALLPHFILRVPLFDVFLLISLPPFLTSVPFPCIFANKLTCTTSKCCYYVQLSVPIPIIKCPYYVSITSLSQYINIIHGSSSF